jgi:predicted RNA-binding protein with PUA domain
LSRELRVATKPKTLVDPIAKLIVKAVTGAMTSDDVIIVKSAADVAGVTAFAKTPTEAINSGEVTEVAVKSAAWRTTVC